MSFNKYEFTYISNFEEDSGNYPAQTYCFRGISVDDGVAWPVVMREFASFLSSIYGYNISDKLLIEEWDGNHASLEDYGS